MIEYKGYYATIEWDAEVGRYYGEVINSGDLPIVLLDIDAGDFPRIRSEFAMAIDNYLSLCARDGIQPEPPHPLPKT